MVSLPPIGNSVCPEVSHTVDPYRHISDNILGHTGTTAQTALIAEATQRFHKSRPVPLELGKAVLTKLSGCRSKSSLNPYKIPSWPRRFFWFVRRTVAANSAGITGLPMPSSRILLHLHTTGEVCFDMCQAYEQPRHNYRIFY